MVMLRKVRTRCAGILSSIIVRYYRFMGTAIGENCYISSGAYIDVDRGKIVIGNNVNIASGSYILGHTGGRPLKEGQETRLEDNVMVFVNAVVLPGVRVGRNSIVGAGTVVTRDVPPNVVVVGSPARVIRHLENEDKTHHSGNQPTEPVAHSDGKDHQMNVAHEIRRFIVENILFGDENGLDETTSFEAKGIFDSVGMLELIVFVEHKFDITILDTEVVPENLDSVQRVAAFVERKLTPPTPH